MIQPARVALRVADIDRSASFYARIVGLDVVDRDGDERAALAAPTGAVLVELRRSSRPSAPARSAAGLFHTAFLYPHRRALAAALRRIPEAGWGLTGASDHGVSEALYLDDPDGHGVELYRDRPRPEWPTPGAGALVGMYTAALDLADLAAERAPDGGPAERVRIGHVHLKVANLDAAARFWIDAVGLRSTIRLGAEADFFADGDYHHHIGANTWLSRGAALAPADAPGLDGVTLAAQAAAIDAVRERLVEAGGDVAERADGVETRTPDGVAVTLEPG